jgi:DnaD/phage-associated family protein
MQFTTIPNLFFSSVLPQIQDIVELKVTLHIFWAVAQKQGYPRFVSFGELLADPTLVSGIKGNGAPEETLRHGLNAAVSRGTLLHLALEHNENVEDIYFVNTEEGRGAVAKIESGELKLGGVLRREPAPTEERPNIFTLYEQNIGILTPLIAEELKEAESTYPSSWIEDSFREAVRLNKRSWRYIQRILQRWAAEGRGYGEPGRDFKAHTDKEYLRGYGRFLRRRGR